MSANNRAYLPYLFFRKYSGFTLIELLIVIVIIGIVSTVSLFAFGDFGASRKVGVAAEQLSNYLQVLEEQAILETSTLGLHIIANGYETYRLENNQWKAFDSNSFFHRREFSHAINASLQAPMANLQQKPEIIINASGEITPFTLFLGTSQQAKLIQLVGKHNGDIIIQKVA